MEDIMADKTEREISTKNVEIDKDGDIKIKDAQLSKKLKDALSTRGVRAPDVAKVRVDI